jgi:hypothetical protein
LGVNGCRARFPIFDRLTYVNSCSQGALSDSVRAAYDDYLTGWDERGAPWEYWVGGGGGGGGRCGGAAGGGRGRER